MSKYVNGELLKKWRRDARERMLAEYARLQIAAESCPSYKSGSPTDYATSMEAMAKCYLRAVECFNELADD